MLVEDVKKLTVEKLKVELKTRDLDISGKKAELAERLEAYLQAEPAKPSAQANGASTSGVAQASSSAPASGRTRQPIVWSPVAAEAAAVAPAALAAAAEAEPAAADADDNATTAAAEGEKQKARAKKFGITEAAATATATQTTHSLASQSLQLLQETGKRKADDAEAAALVSDDLIAKRQARFKTQEQTAEEQRKQRFMDPETVRAKERKERFQQWLPGGAAAGSKSSKDAMAAAIGTSLDSSMPAKGRGKGKHGSAAPQEKFSAEFTAKAEARKARFADKSQS